MIFTREQWFEVWKRHMGPSAESFNCIDLPMDRELGAPEYDCSHPVEGFPLVMNDVLLAIAEKDAEEIGIHSDWIKLWATDPDQHMSLVWVILWIDHPKGDGNNDCWRRPRPGL